MQQYRECIQMMTTEEQRRAARMMRAMPKAIRERQEFDAMMAREDARKESADLNKCRRIKEEVAARARRLGKTVTEK